MKHIYNKLYDNIIVIFLFSIVLLGLIPFLLISYYNVPGASDDIMHAVFQLDKNYLKGVYDWYADGYNGRYANAVIMQMPGRVFMYKSFAKIFPVVEIIAIYMALYYLFSQYTKGGKKTLLWSVLFGTYILAYIPDIQQVYWFSGATVYVFPIIFFLVFLGLHIKIYKQQQIWAERKDNKSKQKYTSSIIQNIILFISGFFIIGSSEIWMGAALSTTVLFYLDTWLKEKKWNNAFLFPLLSVIVFTALVVFAPGTTTRLDGEGQFFNNRNTVGSLIISFISFGTYFQEWFVQLGIGLILLSGFLSKPKSKPVRLLSSLSFPQLIGWFFIVLLFSFFIVHYSLGHLEIIRMRALVPIFVYASLFVLFLLYSGTTKMEKFFLFKIKKSKIYSDILFSAGFLFLIISSQNVQVVYDDLLRGKAKIYEAQVESVNQYMSEHQGENISLPAFTSCPKTFNVSLNNNISMEHFIDIYTNGEGVKVFKENPFYNISSFSRKALEAQQQQHVHVKARIREGNDNGVARLVFECHPYWEGVRLDTIMKGSVLDFNWTLPQGAAFEKDKLKVYFFNSGESPIFIQKASVTPY